MPTPEEVEAALHAARADNVSSPLDFLILQALERGIEHCYLPKGESLIRALAAARDSEVQDAIRRLRDKFGKDFRTQHFKSNIREAKAQLTADAAAERPSGLLTSDSGKPLAGFENAFRYFSGSPAWNGVIGYNEFTGGIELLKTPPQPLTEKPGEEIEDVFDTGATRWLERESGQLFKREVVHHTVDFMARQNRFNPPRDYLAGLDDWDGILRLSTWLADYCNVDPGSDEKPSVAGAIGRMFMISAVARIMEPGCQVDHMLVLEGKTGAGKTSLARALCPNPKWFTRIRDMAGKDALMGVRGKWIIEVPELDALSRADEKTAKRFIDEQTDDYRPPFGHRIITVPRQCVFVGTTEKDDWMRAETGRRFWPVRCQGIDLAGLRRDLAQLWAEALHAYKNGEKWYPDKEQSGELSVEQNKRQAEDPWMVKAVEAAEEIFLQRELIGREVAYVHIPEILAKLGKDLDEMTDQHFQRVGKLLRMAGWEKFQKRLTPGASPSGVYRRSG